MDSYRDKRVGPRGLFAEGQCIINAKLSMKKRFFTE